jgi:ribonucleoside-diphosphate reductase alpha chain
MENNALQVDYTNWEAGKQYPEWMDEISLATVSKGYLLPGETVKSAYKRVANASAVRLKKPELANKFFKLFWNGWVGLASPVLSNMGTDRGLPISCFGIDTPDSIRGIGLTNAELMKLTASGGGVGISLSRIRKRGTSISGNGKSEGVVPWAKIYDSAIIATNQGNVRRGAASVNLDINHGDIDEFLQIRRPKGDPNRQCLNLHQCVVVDDFFMRKLEARDPDALSTWATMTNICSEITLFTDEEHSFICCLSSMNLAKYDEWKDTDSVELATWFLDGVMQEFIDKSSGRESLKRTHKHASKGRALGLGVMGWHTFLQQKGLPFNSIASTAHTHNIFSNIRNKAEKASMQLAQEYGEPLWCRGTGMRNTHLLAIAPTVSNSVITGGISAGIEPLPANVYTFNGAKGTFIRKNKVLQNLLQEKKEDKNKWWDQMLQDGGSAQNLPDTVLSPDEKELFLTFSEINQLELVRQAAIRQKYIDQTQSLNLSFDPNDSPKWINQVHMEAWKLGIKTLYYLRTDSVIKGDLGSRMADCTSCDG